MTIAWPDEHPWDGVDEEDGVGVEGEDGRQVESIGYDQQHVRPNRLFEENLVFHLEEESNGHYCAQPCRAKYPQNINIIILDIGVLY